ncbi:MAG: hypothetical protein A2041_09245 [Bacteroidetes bacterium GWA2_31_9b]|nr:MAG: hypothetical protein A2041_09245 [Bacteroidetes bacterium GWA2_31_9b]
MKKTSIEILESFAKEKGIKCTTNSSTRNYSLNQDERFTSSKFVVFDLDYLSKDMFLIFNDSYTPKAYASNTYCGIFKKIPECKSEIKMSKRFWFDFRRRVKTNDSYIDKSVTIIGEDDKIDRNIVNSKMIGEFLEINKVFEPLELITINKSESNVPVLSGNNFIAIKTNSWILESRKLELFIEEGSKLFKSI